MKVPCKQCPVLAVCKQTDYVECSILHGYIKAHSAKFEYLDATTRNYDLWRRINNVLPDLTTVRGPKDVSSSM